MSQSFATAINCIDGRAQLPVIEFIRKNFGVEHVDMVTEPGVNKKIAENKEAMVVDSVKRSVTISLDQHGSKLIAIVGHHDCSGNPTDSDSQLRHIDTAVARLKSWYGKTTVVGLWVDENWKVRQVT